MARLDDKEAAAYLGIADSTFRRYKNPRPGKVTLDPLPRPGKDGRWTTASLDRWKKNRPGPGPVPGTRREAVHVCENGCGSVVKRRYVDPVTGKRVCKPCYVAGDPIHGGGA